MTERHIPPKTEELRKRLHDAIEQRKSDGEGEFQLLQPGPLEFLQPTLRDQFAMAALTGVIAQSPMARSAAEFAREAWMCADVMLETREPKA